MNAHTPRLAWRKVYFGRYEAQGFVIRGNVGIGSRKMYYSLYTAHGPNLVDRIGSDLDLASAKALAFEHAAALCRRAQILDASPELFALAERLVAIHTQNNAGPDAEAQFRQAAIEAAALIASVKASGGGAL